MIYLPVIVLILTLLCPPVAAQERYTGQTIEEILALPEDRIDLGIACLVLAKDAYPDLNIPGFDAALDYMAAQAHRLTRGFPDPDVRIAAMNTYLYQPGWWNDSLTFDYDMADLEANRKENQFLNGYLSTRTGSCITMPMLHLVLADRLGWPMAAVRAPKHFFVRYVAEGYEKANIEATSYGGYLTDAYYKELTGIPDKAVRNGVYMRTLFKREYIASLLLNNARHFHEREQNLKQTIRYLNLALSVDPAFASAHWNIGHYYEMLAGMLDKEYKGNLEIARTIYETNLRVAAPPSILPNHSSPTPNSSLLDLVQQDDMMVLDLEKLTGIPSGIPAPHVKKSPVAVDPVEAGLRQEYQAEQQRLHEMYAPLIQQTLIQARRHFNEARHLGIVLMSPTRLYQRQEELIERLHPNSP